MVRGIEFQGNDAIDDFTLRNSISTSESAWAARFFLTKWIGIGEKRYFDEIEFRRDVIRLMLLYRQSGFLEARIDTVVRRSNGSISLRFRIDEGRPVRVERFEVDGLSGVEDGDRVKRDLPLGEGQPFNRFRLQASADTIRTRLLDRGYPFVQIFRNFDLDAERYQARVEFEVNPGPRTRVSAIRVEGASQVSEGVIRNGLTFREGDWFSRQQLLRSQRDLYRMDVFDFVNVQLTDTVPADVDTMVSVNVRVTEGRFHRIRTGLGYGTIDCFRTLTSWTANNFLGGGRSLEAGLQLSKIGTGDSPPFGAGFENSVCGGLSVDEGTARLDLNFNATTTLTEPFFLSRNTSASVSLTGERRSELQAFVTERLGGELSFTQRNRLDLPVTLSYGLSYGQTEAEPAVFCIFFDVCRADDLAVFSEPRVQSRIGLGLVRDRANNVFSPTGGSFFSAEVRFADESIGSDELYQFVKAVGEFASYHRISRGSVFAWRIRLGGVWAPRVTEDRVRFVSPDERFYLGGPNSVRGFNQNELGPVVRVVDIEEVTDADSTTREVVRDTIVSPTGGNRVFLANAELRIRFPGLPDRFRLALFVDAGQLFTREQGAREVGMRVTPGIGVRVATPVGPLRLDMAYNPYDPVTAPLFLSRSGELEPQPDFKPNAPDGFFSRLRVHFSVGQAF